MYVHDGISLAADKKNAASSLAHFVFSTLVLEAAVTTLNTETLVTVIVSVERAAGWNNSSYSLTTAHSF